MRSDWTVLPWQRHLLESTEVAAVSLVLGASGIGVERLAVALGMKRLGAEPEKSHVSEPDFLLVEPEDGQIKIDAVRAALEFLSFAAIKRSKKVLVILQAERLNNSALNVLLKTLEEPGMDKHIILSAYSPHLLSAPVVSRCLIIHAPRPAPDEIKSWAGEGASAAQLAFYRHAPLNMTDADGQWCHQLAQTLSAGRALDVAAAARDWTGREASPDGWFDGLQKWVSDIIRVSCRGAACYYPSCGERLAALGRDNPRQWSNFYQHLLLRKQLLDHPLNKNLYLREILHDYRRLCPD